MPTVAIVHAGEDTLPARALAEKLRVIRLDPVLERGAGEELRNAVKDAAVTIALWSPTSVAQQALIEDVAFARGKSKVVHATMRNAEAPANFRNDRTVNLTGWKGDDDFPAWLELATIVTKQAGVPAPPPPAPKPPSGFFQPGRPGDAGAPPAQGRAQQARQQRTTPPPPRPQPAPRAASAPRATPVSANEKSGGGKGLVIGAIAAVVLLGGGAGGYYFWSQSQNATATASAWDSVPRDDASALRAFIDAGAGDFRDEAEAALAQLEEVTYTAARSSDTIEAYESFLNDFPASQHALAVRGRIAELRTAPQPPTVETAPLPQAPANPDLIPPGVTEPTPQTGGPAQITPPAETTPDEEPDSAPTN